MMRRKQHRELTEALRELTAALKERNADLEARHEITSREATKALADAFSAQLGRKVSSQSYVPGFPGGSY